MVKLIAFDLDGTILNDDKKLPKENLKALIKANEMGIITVPTTGRLETFLPPELSCLDFKYVIASNGGSVCDMKEKKYIYKQSIETEKLLKIQKIIDKYNLYAEYYLNGTAYSVNESIETKMKKYSLPEEKRYFLTKKYTFVDDMYEFLKKEENMLEKINFFYVPLEIKSLVKNELDNIDGLCVTSSVPNNLEVNHINANKGIGLKALCDHLKIDLSNVMSIGDNGNDIEMLKVAKFSVAMGNATEEAKIVANYQTCDNNNFGFAKAVEKYALRK